MEQISPVHPEDPDLKFPYIKDVLEPPEIMMKRLFFEFFDGEQSDDYDSRTNVLFRDYEKHWTTDMISCHFTEELRIGCKSGTKPNMYQIWKTQKPETMKSFKTVDDARMHLLGLGAGECNPFNTALAMRLYLGFNDSRCPVKIIDPSAGWGDRMIAAIAAGDFVSQYDGYDPNSKLVEPYRKIIDTLDHTKKCRFHNEPFQTAEVPKEYYDLGVTSPPFGPLETYSEESSQSMNDQTNTYEKWLDNFYRPYLRNLHYAVRSGGKIILYVSDFRMGGKNYYLESNTLNILQKEIGQCVLETRGGFQANLKSKVRPFYVFRKF